MTTLKNIIIHKIIKEIGGKPELICSSQPLPVNNEDVKDFVEKLIKSYGLKNPTYGSFEKDRINYPFQQFLNSYIKDEINFLEFSKTAMSTLNIEISNHQAKGGYVVFIHYEENNTCFVITAMLDNSIQFIIDDNKEFLIEKLKALDLDRLARANRVSIDKWQNNNDTYLSFIKGTREVSLYFQKFIGSTDLTNSKSNANNLKDALKEFMRTNGYDRNVRLESEKKIQNYITKQIEKNEDVKLVSISALVNTENPEHFINFIRDNEKEVGGSFRITHKKHIEFLRKVTYSGKGFKLEFDKDLIKNGIISRHEDDGIIIRGIDSKVLNNDFENIHVLNE